MQILLVSENPTNGCFRRHSDMKDFLVQVNGSRDLIGTLLLPDVQSVRYLQRAMTSGRFNFFENPSLT